MARVLATAFLLVACVLVTTTCARAACTGAVPANAVYYVTDRAAQSDDALFSGERAYGPRRLPKLAFGTIVLPISRATNRPCTSENEFYRSLGSTIGTSGNVLIYIPGYYTSFATATGDALKVRRASHVTGAVIVYSWPSKVTSRLTYINDESNAAWSIIDFRDVLAEVRKRYPNARISFAAHSLGSRFALEGMNALRHDGCLHCFGRTVLFAPDVDSDTLLAELHASQLCTGPPKTMPVNAAPVLLYVSNRDVALRQSQTLHGHQRAGQAGNEMILCSGVDTIDVSYFKSSDRAGHSYQVDARIAGDAQAAFSGTPPLARGLKAVKRGNEVYYELR